MRFEKCPVGCKSSLIPSGILIPEGTLLECDVCGQLLSNASEELYKTTMARFDNIHRMDTNPRVHMKRLSRVRYHWKKSPSDTRVLDVGCSFGMFLRVLRSSGFVAEGVEPSEQAVNKCREEGFKVHHGLLGEIALPENSYDVITLYEVLEHLQNPGFLLEECYRILRNGGMMFISTGNAHSLTAKFLKGRWDYFSMEDGGQGHISFFNPKSIALLSTSIGFKVRAIESKRLKLVNKKYDKGFKYMLGKAAQETLNPLVKFANMGHDMLAVLEK